MYDNSTFDVIVRNLFDEEEIDGVLIATLFTDSVSRLSRMLDIRNIPYVLCGFQYRG